MSKIAIIGSGNVGSALQRGLMRTGHDVKTSHEQDAKEKASWGEIVILAVPYAALEDVASKLGDVLSGKVVVDCTNALTKDMAFAHDATTSGAEMLQKKIPGAKVVKCFNTVFAQHMDSGKVAGKQLTVFAAGNDEAARRTVLGLAKAIGFDGVDGGVLSNARSLEMMGYFNIQLGYTLGMGTNVGMRLYHDEKR